MYNKIIYGAGEIKIKLHMEQRSDEWLDIRKGKFTGSDIYKLMTESKSKNEQFGDTAKTYIIDKIAEKYAVDIPNDFKTPAMQWGEENEPLAKKWYSKITGKDITDIAFIHHPKFPLYAGGSPDGFIENDNHIIEIKCPFNSSNHIKYIMIEPSRMKQECKEYYWQMQFYMEIMNVDYCDFISFDKRINADWGLHIKRIDKNKDDVQLMNDKIDAAIEYQMKILNQIVREV